MNSSNQQEKIDPTDEVFVKPLAHKYCAEYIGGGWKFISLDDFKLERIT